MRNILCLRSSNLVKIAFYIDYPNDNNIRRCNKYIYNAQF